MGKELVRGHRAAPPRSVEKLGLHASLRGFQAHSLAPRLVPPALVRCFHRGSFHYCTQNTTTLTSAISGSQESRRAGADAAGTAWMESLRRPGPREAARKGHAGFGGRRPRWESQARWRPPRQREGRPEALEDRPPRRSLIRSRLPAPGRTARLGMRKSPLRNAFQTPSEQKPSQALGQDRLSGHILPAPLGNPHPCPAGASSSPLKSSSPSQPPPPARTAAITLPAGVPQPLSDPHQAHREHWFCSRPDSASTQRPRSTAGFHG